MRRALRACRRVLRAIGAAPASLTEAFTGALPGFRWETWSVTDRCRWLLTNRPLAGRQPACARVHVWGLGRLTLLRVTP